MEKFFHTHLFHFGMKSALGFILFRGKWGKMVMRNVLYVYYKL